MEPIRALKYIKHFGPEHPELGLCNNYLGVTYRSLNKDLAALGVNWANWDHYSGSPYYPVEGRDSHCRDRVDGVLWDNPMRWDLLHWLIKQLEAR